MFALVFYVIFVISVTDKVRHQTHFLIVKCEVCEGNLQRSISRKKDVILKNVLTFPCHLRNPKSQRLQHLKSSNKFHEENKTA